MRSLRIARAFLVNVVSPVCDGPKAMGDNSLTNKERKQHMDDIIIIGKYVTFWAIMNTATGIWYLLYRMEQVRLERLKREGFFRKHRFARNNYAKNGKWPEDYPDDLPLR